MTKSSRRKSWVFEGVEWEAGICTTAEHRRMMMSVMSGAMAGAQSASHRSSLPSSRTPSLPYGLYIYLFFGTGKRKRPDKKPFILGIPGSLFHASRTIPEPCTRRDMVIGESFWKLSAYIDSVPAHVHDRISGKSPHLLVSGARGSGKSYLLTAAAAMLGYAETVMDRRNLSGCISMNGDSYKCVLVSDCKAWLDSPDPLQYMIFLFWNFA